MASSSSHQALESHTLASQTHLSNQDAAEGGSQTEITEVDARGDTSQTEISNQMAAEDGTGTDITDMDASLYKAVAEGNMDILEKMSGDGMLLQLTPKKNTILHIAAQFGQLHCVNKFLSWVDSPSSLLLQPNQKGDTPLHLAAREGHWVVTRALIEAAKKLPSASGIESYEKNMLSKTNNENDTALHEAVRYNHPHVVKLLIEEDPNFKCGANCSVGTPLYLAAERGFQELVQIIIDTCRESSSARSGLTGRTALHAAVICNNEDMTKKILDWNSGLTKQVDENGWSPLHCAAYLGYTSIARQLLEKSDKSIVYLPVKNYDSKTALHLAASCGHTEIVKLLVSRYPDCCEQVDDIGNNALHLIMIKRGIYSSSGLFNFPWMSFRGLMNEKNFEGKTPLHLLADYQMFDCRSFMMHKMVDKMALDKTNSTPIDIMLSAEDLYGKKVPILRRLRSAKGSIGPLGWQKVIKQDIEGRRKKKEEQISDTKKAARIHVIVATLIATVACANGFKLPDVYHEKKGKDQGITIHKDSIGWDTQRQIYFDVYIFSDMLALMFSVAAILSYFLMAFSKEVDRVSYLIIIGHTFTYSGLIATILAFYSGLYSGLPSGTFP